MDVLIVVLVAVAMAVGLVGTVLPVLPGLVLIWLAGLAYGLGAGFDATWVPFAIMSVLLVIGYAASVALPGAKGAAAGAPRSTLLSGAAGAIVGFFVIPVVGIVVGGVGATYLAELSRTGDRDAAWRSTKAVLVGFGLSALAELAAGLGMVVAWISWLFAG
ncbi:hypothetical protein BH23ACT8_BH23ACT8_02050 [soil metagenome]